MIIAALLGYIFSVLKIKFSLCLRHFWPTLQPFHAANSMTKTPTSVPTNADALTLEKVQQMVLSALSALGIQGKSNDISSPWFVDSGASNHMTGTSEHLNNVGTYNDTQNIHIADGNTLSITAVGDITPSFRDVFVSPGLVSNLISVGQLVDNNCNINFSRAGCVVQDQVSGKVIAMGPKVGRLFPLQFTLPRLLSFNCTGVPNKYEDWHKKLGHPNSVVLSHLLKNGFLSSKITIPGSSL